MASEDPVREAARLLAEQVRATRERGGRTAWRSVSSLLAATGADNLTAKAREVLTQALAEQGVVVEPALTDERVHSSSRVRLASGPVAEPVRAPLTAPPTARPTELDRPYELRPEALIGPVRVISVAPDVRAHDVYPDLATRCPSLDFASLLDVLDVDRVPGVVEFNAVDGTTIVRIVTFGLVEVDEEPGDRDPEPGANAYVQPVHLLAGPGWLVGVWHDSARLGDTDLDTQAGPIMSVLEDLLERVSGRFPGGRSPAHGHEPTSVEIALRVAERLSRAYIDPIRHLEDLLDAWTLGFGASLTAEEGAEAERDLLTLQAQAVGLQRGLRPLENQMDAELTGGRRPSWARTEAELLRSLRWQRTLTVAESRVSALADGLRSSYQLVVVSKMTEQLRSAERAREFEKVLARRQQGFGTIIAVGGTLLLVPSTVGAIWGMNVGVPGEGVREAFWFLLLLMLVLTGAAVGSFLFFWRRDSAGSED